MLFSGSKNTKNETNEESKSDNLRYSFQLFDSENKCKEGQTNEEYMSVNTEKESKTKPSDREKPILAQK